MRASVVSRKEVRASGVNKKEVHMSRSLIDKRGGNLDFFEKDRSKMYTDLSEFEEYKRDLNL